MAHEIQQDPQADIAAHAEAEQERQAYLEELRLDSLQFGAGREQEQRS